MLFYKESAHFWKKNTSKKTQPMSKGDLIYNIRAHCMQTWRHHVERHEGHKELWHKICGGKLGSYAPAMSITRRHMWTANQTSWQRWMAELIELYIPEFVADTEDGLMRVRALQKACRHCDPELAKLLTFYLQTL